MKTIIVGSFPFAEINNMKLSKDNYDYMIYNYRKHITLDSNSEIEIKKYLKERSKFLKEKQALVLYAKADKPMITEENEQRFINDSYCYTYLNQK